MNLFIRHSGCPFSVDGRGIYLAENGSTTIDIKLNRDQPLKGVIAVSLRHTILFLIV